MSGGTTRQCNRALDAPRVRRPDGHDVVHVDLPRRVDRVLDGEALRAWHWALKPSSHRPAYFIRDALYKIHRVVSE